MNEINYLLSTKAVRERSQKLFDYNLQGKGAFNYHPEKWDEVTAFVLEVIKENYPDLNIPFHSRIGHFRAGKIDRLTNPNLDLQNKTSIEKFKTLVDLIIPSVLLDAGAGDTWNYVEKLSSKNFNRSEGLGVASFYMFVDKKFSNLNLVQTDAQGLLNLYKKTLEEAFQVNAENPLVGVEGRLHLLKELGNVIKAQKDIFKNERPSDLIPLMTEGNTVNAEKVLSNLLKYLGGIWPKRLQYQGVDLGDTWSHPALGAKNSFESMIPFHKLSQWLSYSILDAAIVSGLQVSHVESLTGLPEYRNGGLFLDMGLITPKDLSNLTKGVSAEDLFTIEWRAMTIVLLDELAKRIQDKIQKTPSDFPLAKVLEGGSWWAGRKIASIKRSGGTPPLKIISDGTVF